MANDHPRTGSPITADLPARPRRGPGRQTPGQTEQRNVHLLDTALEHFIERGFEGASIEGIAATARMAKRTVYLRYGNKTKLFKVALQHAIDQWIVPIERLRGAETSNIEETLLRVGQILLANIVSVSGIRLMRITNSEAGRMPEIGRFTYAQGTAPTLAYLADLVRRRIKPAGKEAAKPEQLAQAFLSLVVSRPATLSAWGIPLEQSKIEEETRLAVHLFLNGVMGPTAQSRGPRHVRGPQTTAGSSSDVMSTSEDMQALEEENRRLKLLLAKYVLEAESPRGAR